MYGVVFILYYKWVRLVRRELGVRLLEVGENVEPLTQLHDILVETSILAVRSKR